MGLRLRRLSLRAVGAISLALCGAPAATAAEAGPRSLANGCFTIAAPDAGASITQAGPGSYEVRPRAGARAARFHLKPTGVTGRYMLHDSGGGLLGVVRGAVGRLEGPEAAGPAAEWSLTRAGARGYALTSASDRQRLAVRGRRLVLGPRSAALFRLTSARACRRFPEAGVGWRGRPFKGTRRDGTVAGFIDTHLHLTAD
ncbi:MAG TPA: hypothetical protein VEQ61_10365, partial [Thermoleophilaceae bacterium]|nr:hypothetical protein [Thermoleophilaceae bacterium]